MTNVVPFPKARRPSEMKFIHPSGITVTLTEADGLPPPLPPQKRPRRSSKPAPVQPQAAPPFNPRPMTDEEHARLRQIVDKVAAKWNDPTFRAGVRHCQDCPKGRT